MKGLPIAITDLDFADWQFGHDFSKRALFWPRMLGTRPTQFPKFLLRQVSQALEVLFEEKLQVDVYRVLGDPVFRAR